VSPYSSSSDFTDGLFCFLPSIGVKEPAGIQQPGTAGNEQLLTGILRKPKKDQESDTIHQNIKEIKEKPISFVGYYMLPAANIHQQMIAPVKTGFCCCCCQS
jgi:hypothetical protein